MKLALIDPASDQAYHPTFPIGVEPETAARWCSNAVENSWDVTAANDFQGSPIQVHRFADTLVLHAVGHHV
jgi:hypothetical protein